MGPAHKEQKGEADPLSAPTGVEHDSEAVWAQPLNFKFIFPWSQREARKATTQSEQGEVGHSDHTICDPSRSDDGRAVTQTSGVAG